METVFLDAGGVLVYPNWQRISDVLKRHGVSIPAGALASAEPPAKRRLDVADAVRSTTDTSRGWLYFNLILEQAGIVLSGRTDAALAELHDYHAHHNLWELVPPHVPAVLAALCAKGLKLAVVSNANGTLRGCFRRLGLEPSFACVLDSCEEGVEKPDPRIFRYALTRTGADPATTIHVGDFFQIDVMGARAAGIRGVLLDEGGLYPDADCFRIRSLHGLLSAIEQRAFD